MLFETKDGTVFIQSRYSQRAWSLTFLVTTYGLVAAWVVEAEGDRANSLRVLSRVQGLIDDPWMDRARNGRVDEELGLPPIV